MRLLPITLTFLIAVTLVPATKADDAPQRSPELTGEVVLHAIDIDSQKPIPNVEFFKSNSSAEVWVVKLGKTDAKGKLLVQSRPTPGYYFSVWEAPGDYKVVGLDDVASSIRPGSTVTHRFYLRKPAPSRAFPEIEKVPNDQPHPVPFPAQQEHRSYIETAVNNMPGFRGQRVQFRLYPDKDEDSLAAQQRLAAQIFYSGRRVAAAVKDELTYFQKAETSDKGNIAEMKDILVVIRGRRHWRFWCRLPNGLPLKQNGYKVDFDALESWDLIIPDYLQPGYKR